MTKIAKRSIFTLLSLILVAAFAVTAYSFTSTMAAEGESNVEKFIRIVQTFEGKEIDDDLLNSPEAKAFAEEKGAIYLYLTPAPEGLTDEEKAGLPEEIKNLYEQVYAVFAEPYAVKAKIAALYDFANTDIKDIMYAENAEVESIEAEHAALSENGKTLVESLIFNGLDNLTKARAKLDEKKALIDSAIAAIDNITYYNAESKTMESAAEGNEIVLSSKSDIDAATEALNSVYGRDIFSEDLAGERIFITNLDVYSSALSDYQAWVDKANAVKENITEVSESVIAGEVYYTKKADIENAKKAYDNLYEQDKRLNQEGNVNYNDLQSLIDQSVKTLLDDMLGEISAIEGKIANVVTLIESIPDGDALLYTSEHNQLIKTAEEAFIALDADIKANDCAVYGGAEGAYIVTGYAKMADARKVWDGWKAEVDSLVGILNELVKNDGTEGFNIVNAFIEIKNKFDAFTEEQKTEFRNTVIDFADGQNSCNDVMAYYQAKINRINSAVLPVINLIGMIPKTATVTKDYYNALKAAEDAYNALAEEYKTPVNYVTNVDVLEKARADYDKLTEDVTAWQNKLENITLGYVHTDNMHLVDESVELFNNISETAKEVIMTSSEGDAYYDDYNKYLTAIDEKTALLDALKEIAVSMNALDSNQPSMEDIAAYDAAYQEVKGKFDALSNTDREWFVSREDYFADDENTVTYKAAYEKYLSVLDNAAAVHVEVLIADILTPVTLAGKATIDSARVGYDALSDVQKSKVRNYQSLTDAESALNSLTAELDAWTDSVEALMGGADIENLWSVDLDAVAALEVTYSGYDSDEQAYVAEGRELLDSIKAKSDERIADLGNRISEIPSTINKSDKEVLENIRNDYEKLHDTQKVSVDYQTFMTQYNKVIFASYFDQAVNTIKKEVDAGHFVLEDKIAVDMLKSVLTSASAELRGLVETADILDEIEQAYQGKELKDLTTEYENLENLIKEKETAINDKIAQLGLEDESIKESIKETADALENELKAYADEKDEELKADLEAQITALKAALEKYASDKDAETLADLEAKINALEKALKEYSDLKDGEVVADLEAKINALEKALKEYSDLKDGEFVADIEAKITALKAALEKYASDKDAEIVADLEAKITALETALKQYTDSKNDSLKEELIEKINQLEQTLNAKDKEIENTVQEVNARAERNLIIVCAVFMVMTASLTACVIVLFRKSKR